MAESHSNIYRTNKRNLRSRVGIPLAGILLAGTLPRKDNTTMKTSMYFNYTSRSLLRGGQRTILAVFCVAVGVMAIVALQLAGSMLQSSLTTNTRDTNGGDVAAMSHSGARQTTELTLLS